MADKTTLSIKLSVTDDKATVAVRSFMSKIRAALAPMRQAFAPLKTAGGALVGLFKSIGAVIGDVLGKIPLIGGAIAGVIGGAVVALKSFIDSFDELGDKSEAVGVTADFLAQMRFAAKKSGAEVDALDSGMQNFTKNLGQARAGTGRMTAFLNRVSPALLKQLKAAKGNEDAFLLLGDAFKKLQDPAKRAALAQATLGDASLAPLLARGADGIRELGDRYATLAGRQQGAVDAASDFDDANIELEASIQGIKASLVQGLAPALTIVVGKLRDWFSGHREDIKTWAMEFGEKLPGAISAVTSAIGTAVDKLKDFFSVMSDIISQGDAAKTFFLGDDLLDDASTMELVNAGGQEGITKLRARGLLKGTADLSRQEKINRAQSWLKAAAEITSRDHSEFEQERADAMRVAAQQLREQAGFGDKDLRRLTQTGGAFGMADLARMVVGSTKPQNAKIDVTVKAAPGTQVRTSIDPTSTADVDVTTGNQLAPAVP